MVLACGPAIAPESGSFSLSTKLRPTQWLSGFASLTTGYGLSGSVSNCCNAPANSTPICQVNVEGKIWQAVLAPSGSRLEAQLPPSTGRFRFGLLVLPPSDGTTSAPMTFSVAASRGLGWDQLFTRTVEGETAGKHGAAWFDLEIPPNRGGSKRLALEVRAADPIPVQETPVGVWVSPVFFAPGRTYRGVILLSMDTVRWDFVGPDASGRSLTPNLDRLAEEGVLFDRAYAAAAWTVPSHASMLTGLVPRRHGVLDFSDRISCGTKTIAETLSDEGFLCFACTGGGAVSNSFGFTRGFLEASESEGREEPDASTPVFQTAVRFLKRAKGNDFFLFLHTYQFHDPLNPPEEVLRRLNPGRHLSMTSVSLADMVAGRRKYRPLPPEQVDGLRDLYRAEAATIDERLVGPLVAYLKDEGLYDSTLLIITSDHGEELFDHGGWQHAHSLYDEVVHVPLVVKLPNGRYAGTRVGTSVSLVDVVPTILDALRLKRTTSYDGSSVLPMLAGARRTDHACFMEVTELRDKPIFKRKLGVVRGNFKLIINEAFDDWQDHLDHPPAASDPVQLFDLTHDPAETVNCISQHPETVRSLMDLLRGYAALRRMEASPSALNRETESELRALGYLQ